MSENPLINHNSKKSKRKKDTETTNICRKSNGKIAIAKYVAYCRNAHTLDTFLMKGDKRCTLRYIHWFAWNAQGTNAQLMHFISCNVIAIVTYCVSVVGQLICCNLMHLQWIYRSETSAMTNGARANAHWIIHSMDVCW